MVAQYCRFYSQGIGQVLDMMAKTFFAMCGEMYKIEAQEDIRSINNSNPSQDYIKSLVDKEKGIDQTLKEIRVIKSLQK